MIKKIYAFGTSHSCGGGFEFNTFNSSPNPDIYKKIINSENHFDFSYPSILSKLTNIEVDNRAKQGYGYERVTRQIFDVVNDDLFDKDTSLFLIEISDWDRQEFWFNRINDYVIVNSHPMEMQDANNISIANDYHYQSYEVGNEIKNNKELFDRFIQYTSNIDNLIEKLQINFLFLVNFLENQKIKYLLTNGDVVLPINSENLTNHRDNILKYNLHDFTDNKTKIVTNWVDKVFDFKITISDESSQQVKDNHQGYSVSEYIAKTIFNKMVDLNYISMSKIDCNFLNSWKSIKNKINPLM